MIENVTIYLHSGDRLVAAVNEDDFEMEMERLVPLNATHKWPDGINTVEELIESVLTLPPKPRWLWIGDAYVFSQAVAGVSVAGDTTKENQ